MNSEITFKKCTESDIENLITASQKIYPEHYSHIWKNNDTSYYINLSFNQTVFETDFKIENILYFLIHYKNQIVGLLKIRKHEKIEEYSIEDALQLEKIYLLKESLGLGIGKKGIEYTKNYARRLGKKVIWLDVMTTSPALYFYKKMGFATRSYYQLDYPGLKDGYREMQRMLLIL